MNYFKNYYENIVQYDLINKFQYKNINKLPKLHKVVLTFGYKKSNLKQLIISLVALELISAQKPVFTTSKVSNVTLKIRKGNPVGCKITLRKNKLNIFLVKLINKFFCDTKLVQNNGKINDTNISFSPTLTFKLKNNLIFSELEIHYQIFKNLSNLNIILITNSKTSSEFLFLLKSHKIFSKYLQT